MTTHIRVPSKADIRQALERAFPGDDAAEARRIAAGHLADRKLDAFYSDTLDCRIVVGQRP